jgi:hypothetical protein
VFNFFGLFCFQALSVCYKNLLIYCHDAPGRCEKQFFFTAGLHRLLCTACFAPPALLAERSGAGFQLDQKNTYQKKQMIRTKKLKRKNCFCEIEERVHCF